MALAQEEAGGIRSADYERLVRFLARVRQKSKMLILADAAVRAGVILLAALVVAFALDNLLHLPRVIRLMLAVAIPVGALLLLKMCISQMKELLNLWDELFRD